MEKQSTEVDAREALHILRPFICTSQLVALRRLLRCEERQFFFDKLVELAALVQTMPKVYEQEKLGDKALVYLHYFKGSADLFITERDESMGQHQAFGLADLFGDGGELGYISIAEALEAGVELDLYWSAKTLAEVQEQRATRRH